MDLLASVRRCACVRRALHGMGGTVEGLLTKRFRQYQAWNNIRSKVRAAGKFCVLLNVVRERRGEPSLMWNRLQDSLVNSYVLGAGSESPTVASKALRGNEKSKRRLSLWPCSYALGASWKLNGRRTSPGSCKTPNSKGSWKLRRSLAGNIGMGLRLFRRGPDQVLQRRSPQAESMAPKSPEQNCAVWRSRRQKMRAAIAGYGDESTPAKLPAIPQRSKQWWR